MVGHDYDGIVLIDTPHKPSDAMRLRADVERRGRLRYILNTEPHGDHWTGNAYFDAPVVAHEGVRMRILTTDLPAHVARVASQEGTARRHRKFALEQSSRVFCSSSGAAVGNDGRFVIFAVCHAAVRAASGVAATHALGERAQCGGMRQIPAEINFDIDELAT